MLSYDDLVNDLFKGCKPRDEWRIGIELERFSYLKDAERPTHYEGPQGIGQLLSNFANRYGWSPQLDNGNAIALSKDGSALTLEPGGQVEFSGKPHKNLHEACHEMRQFYKDLKEVADEIGIGFLSKGFHPEWRREDMNIMPKQRYEIMMPYMAKVDSLGLDMMFRTCGAQVNLDFDSEEDMVKKMRVSLALQPFVTALMANSDMVEGRPIGYQSYRAHVWTKTDNDRSGFLDFVFDDDMGFRRYVDYALDVPMYFVYRDGKYIDVSGQSFRDFMDGKLKGFEGEYPTLSDWSDHLTTLFPEIRLKHYLEFRGNDSHSPEMVFAMAGFWVGLLYDSENLDRAASLIADWSLDMHHDLLEGAARNGLDYIMPDGRVLAEHATELVTMAAAGTARLQQFSCEMKQSPLAPFVNLLNAHLDSAAQTAAV